MHANRPKGLATILECFFARFGLALSLPFKCSNVFCFDLSAPRQTVAAMNDWHLRSKIGRSDCIFQRTTAWSRQVLVCMVRIVLAYDPMQVIFLNIWKLRNATECCFSLSCHTPGMDERRGWAFEPNASAMSSRGAKGFGCWLRRQGTGNLPGRALRQWLPLLWFGYFGHVMNPKCLALTFWLCLALCSRICPDALFFIISRYEVEWRVSTAWWRNC